MVFAQKSKFHSTSLPFSAFLIAFTIFSLLNLSLWNWSAPGGVPLSAAMFREDLVALETGRPVSWWLAKGYLEEAKAPDIVLFGSSQACGLRAADALLLNKEIDFCRDHSCYSLERDLPPGREGHSLKVFIASHPGATVADYYIISRALFRVDRMPKLVIITFSPRDFMDNSLPYIGATQPFQFFSKFVELGVLQTVAYPDVASQLDWMVNSRLPVKQINRLVSAFAEDRVAEVIARIKQVTGSNMYSNSDRHLHRKLANVIFAFTTRIRPGEYLFSPRTPKKFLNNRLEYAIRYRTTNPPGFAQELRFFKENLALLRNTGIQVLAVNMPLMQSNREQLPSSFWREFRRKIGDACRESGSKLVDLSDSRLFQESDFVDSVHLNADGGAKLSKIISQQLVQDGALADCLDLDRSSELAVTGQLPLEADKTDDQANRVTAKDLRHCWKDSSKSVAGIAISPTR